MMEKAGSRGADVLVLDLEDGVHPDHKDEARSMVREAYRRIDFGGSEVFVRANAMDTSWMEADLAMLEGLRPDGVVLPKVESASVVVTFEKRLSGVPLFLMIETARGVVESGALARLPGVRGLLFGAADYRASLRAGRLGDESELLCARMSVLHAARAADPAVEAFDTPWFEYKDLEGLGSSARRARSLGFDGKTAIHPGQVETINRVFSPTPAEVERAQAIVEVMERALADGRNVATLGSEMVEALHLAEARRILERAKG
jgi:citrate lyase subunit beta/citryl-CoA lyase